MKNMTSTDSQDSPTSAARPDMGFSPWQRLKSKRISYLVLPLLFMATVTEFVILATGWKYQQVVCLPPGMKVTFFSIGPIGATILAVELLKLPLAIWTASRHGWQKGFMICVGLPLICILTFQLVKDMAVYEMGVAMTPAAESLQKAMVEETKISQLNGELTGIEEKRAERERRIAALTAKQTKAKADLEESIKRNEEARQDAISLTDYQKKELSEAQAREAAIVQQFATDTEQLTKAIADLRARRETEFTRSAKDSANWETRKAAYDAAFGKWKVEEARIDNEYQTAVADYTNRKNTYEKDKAAYAAANFLHRQVMREPVDPGVPPVREVNRLAKPADLDGRPSALVEELDQQIKSKEAELLAVNNKRRDRVAAVDADARRLRQEFDTRSTGKREEADRKREELSASLAALATEAKTERDAIDKEFQSALQTSDGIRAEIDACRKRAEVFYEEREAAIRKTQVHRIATTVEIVRGLIKGERPMSIKTSAKERGDILTDQISMVRIWVYPVLAFIVAFLPTLMVEIGFSTVFEPEQERPPHRFGFLGRQLHWVETRAGRIKILHHERVAKEATAQIAARDQAVAAANAAADKALFEKDAELQSAHEAMSVAAAKHQEQLHRMQTEHAEEFKARDEAMSAAAARHQEQLNRVQAEHADESKAQEEKWVAKLAGTTDSLNRTIIEKDALRDLQNSEIERQIQMRQNAWSDRLTQLRKELDDQRTAIEAERTTLMQEHHQKLLEVSEDCKTQVIQARRQAATAELAATDSAAKLNHDLKQALEARDAAEAQLQQQAESFTLQLTHAKEDATREADKAARQERHRAERQQMEAAKTLRQREEDFEHQLKQREQEIALEFEARLAEQQTRIEQDGRRRENELQREIEARAEGVAGRWKQEAQQREEAAQIRLKQREQQLQVQAEARVNEVQTQAEQELRRQESEFQRQLEAQAREADTRLKQELQQKELAFQTKLKQREQELALRVDARETELQNQRAAELRAREQDWERQAEQELRRRQTELERRLESQTREAETRLKQELEQKELAFQERLNQHEQEWALKADAREIESVSQRAAEVRSREQEWERQAELRVRAAEARLAQEAQQKEELTASKGRQRDQQWQAKVEATRAELQAQHEEALRRREADAEAALHQLEARLRKEMQQREEEIQELAKQRERDLIAQVTAQAESRHAAAQAQWESETEIRTRAAVEPVKALLVRTEKERDEARYSATEGARHVQMLEKKLNDASSFLITLRNGKNVVGSS
jgi:hypothetical protein